MSFSHLNVMDIALPSDLGTFNLSDSRFARTATLPSNRIPSLLPSRFICRRSTKFHAFCIVSEPSVRGSALDSVSAPKTRRLVLLRHGQSSWADRTLRDHDRPLNEHGRSSSASLAMKLCQIGWVPDLVLCSDSARTRETFDIMGQHIPQFSDADVHFFGSFYSVAAMDGQTAQHLQLTICKHAKDDTFTVMCIGHNRGWEEAASFLSGTPVELKTANAALLEAQGNSWQEAFDIAGVGGWICSGIVKPDGSNMS